MMINYVAFHACISSLSLSWQIISSYGMSELVNSKLAVLLPTNWSPELAFFQSEWNVNLLINFAASFFTLIFLIIKKYGFGRFSELENKRLTQRLVGYLVLKATILMFVVNFGKFHKLWIIWFFHLAFLKMLSALGKILFEKHSASSTVTLIRHLKTISLLLFTIIATIASSVVCIKLTKHFSWSLLFLANFETSVIVLEALQTLILNVIHVADNVLEVSDANEHKLVAAFRSLVISSLKGLEPSDWGSLKNQSLYLVTFVGDLANRVLNLVYVSHVWWRRGIRLRLIDVFLALQFQALVHEIYDKTVKAVKSHFIRQKLHSEFPDATSAELRKNADDCAICKDEMWTAKKLPCGHLFHLKCIISWLNQETPNAVLCPTCRAPFRELSLADSRAQIPNEPQEVRERRTAAGRDDTEEEARRQDELRRIRESRPWLNWIRRRGRDRQDAAGERRESPLLEFQRLLRNERAAEWTTNRFGWRGPVRTRVELEPNLLEIPRDNAPAPRNVDVQVNAGGFDFQRGLFNYGRRGLGLRRLFGLREVNLQEMLEQVRQVLPQYPDEIILEHLRLTHSAEETILNLATS